jgi:hypothetical protein
MPSLRAASLLSGLTLAGALCAPRGVLAQAATAAAPADAPHTQVISISPLSLVFGLIGAEYERKLSPTMAFGASGSYFRGDFFTYSSIEGKYRYYPQAKALEGFAISATGGLTRIGSRDSDLAFDSSGESANAFSIGTAVDYQWLTGAKKNFAITLGVGARRLILIGDGVDGASLTLPTVRISIGRAF